MPPRPPRALPPLALVLPAVLMSLTPHAGGSPPFVRAAGIGRPEPSR